MEAFATRLLLEVGLGTSHLQSATRGDTWEEPQVFLLPLPMRTMVSDPAVSVGTEGNQSRAGLRMVPPSQAAELPPRSAPVTTGEPQLTLSSSLWYLFCTVFFQSHRG